MDSDTKTCAGSYGACREAMLEILGEQAEDGVDVDANGGDGDDGRGGVDGEDVPDVICDSHQLDIFLIQPDVNPGS